MEDIEIQCKGCHRHFIFGVGEQGFLQQMYQEGKIPEVHQPKRCKECRLKKKELVRQAVQTTASPQRNVHRFEGDDELIRELNK